MKRARGILAAILIAFALAGCTDGHDRPNRVSPTVSSPPSSSSAVDEGSLPKPVGPLAGLRWPANALTPGLLLHDDGHRLSVVPLQGKPRVIWRHPTADVSEIAAAPDGTELAYSVWMHPKSGEDPSSILYLMGADGSVQTIDVAHDFYSIQSPTFLHTPTDPQGPVRLYWVRTKEDVSPETGRPAGQVMVLDDVGPVPVQVPLRYGEAPFWITGYAGSASFTLTLIRQNDVPTRLQVLRNNDYFRNALGVSLTQWGLFEPEADTDIYGGVAWLTPHDYVIAIADADHFQDYNIRLFRTTCEYYGSELVYRGRDIDLEYFEQSSPWPLLAVGADQVLVLRASDVKQLGDQASATIPWLSLDVKTGKLTETGAMWDPSGWWTFVQPQSSLSPGVSDKGCAGLDYTYP